MSLEALLIVLMAGTEIFRPLRDLRGVLHQGLNGQAAATGINALLDTPVTAPGPATAVAALAPEIVFEHVGFAYPGGRRAAHTGLTFRDRRRRARRDRRAERRRKVHHRAAAAAAA